jgi:NAD(P)-dependent dehydrogenase (short-subunit alcohol dehydrogenase family)
VQAPSRIAVTGSDQPVGRAIAQSLSNRAANVAELLTASGDRDRDASLLNEAVEWLGGLDALVISGCDASATTPIAFEDLTDADFEATWERSMQGMLWTLQAAIPHLRVSQGVVVVVVPTTAMTGGAEYAASATAFEGQRILVKSAARQLGPEGIRCNTIAIAPELLLVDSERAEVRYLAPGAGIEPSLDQVGDVVSFLVCPAGRHLNGQTLTVDDGRWMMP